MRELSQFVDKERSADELRMFVSCSTFSAFLHQVCWCTEGLNHDVLRSVLAAMREDVYGTDFSDGPPEQEGAMKTAIADCEELLEHALGIQPAVFNKQCSLTPFLPDRYGREFNTDSSLVVQWCLTFRFLFFFLAMAVNVIREHGMLSEENKSSLRDWCTEHIAEFQVSDLSKQEVEALRQDAVEVARAFLGRIC